MKKFFITMLVFCFVQYSFSQGIKSIRVNNAILGHSWSYDISEIDSITYDLFTQLQKIYVNGECKESILEDVNSLSFSTKEAVNVVFSKDYIDGADSYIFSNGIVLVEKEDSLQGKVIIVDSLDISQSQWSQDKSFMIYCDSIHKPLIAKDSQFIFYFTYDDNGNLIEVNATDLEGKIVSPINASVRRNTIHKASTEGLTTGDDIGEALKLYETFKTMYDPNKENLAGTAASWFVEQLPEGIPRDLLELAPVFLDMLQGNKLGLLGSLLSYMETIQHLGEKWAKHLIGDCTPYIKSAYQEGNNSVIINVQIEGVTSTSQYTPYYVIKYWTEVNGSRTNVTYYTSPQKATNGTHPVTISNLNSGHYGFQVLIFPSLFLEYDNLINLYNFRSNIAYVDIAPLYFKTIEQAYTTYANDYVTVSVKAVLDFPSEQDQTIMSNYDSYGLYYKYDDNINQREEYISVKENGGLEFYINFDIPKEDFLCDYSNFVATCANKITFKTYSIDGWGIKKFYDEKEPQILYDEKPNITFKRAYINSIGNGYNSNNEIVSYIIHYSFDYDVTGTFWFSDIQYQIKSSNINNMWPKESVTKDGSYRAGGSLHIGNNNGNTEISHTAYYQMFLNNGTTINSSNSLLFSGTAGNPSLSVSGAPAQAPTKAMEQTNNQKEIISSMFFESMQKK